MKNFNFENNMHLRYSIFLLLAILNLASCKSSKQANEEIISEDNTITQVVDFSGNNAYKLVKEQCNFGPRVPGTAAHSQCASWLESTLKQLCDTVIIQEGQVTTFDGKTLDIKNIIGSFNPSNSDRILLLAHWDCRPWADHDPDPAKRKEPVMGANDAASGVAVLLELARLMKEKKPNIGIDILLVDAEDWGTNDVDDSWALGTQYWAQHQHVQNYSPRFGILLDMVGARGAKFYKEGLSLECAEDVVNQVWDIAQKSGFNSYFDKQIGSYITDDHKVVNEAGIKCIDIIDMRNSSTGFFDGWHTTSDTLDRIDQDVLKAVGQVVANVIYSY